MQRRIGSYLCLAVAFTSVGLTACPKDKPATTPDAGSDAAAPSDENKDPCLASCETVAHCQGFPLSGCEGEISCSRWPAANWRSEVSSAYLACQKRCPTDLESCNKVAFDVAGPARAIDMQYATACAAKKSACKAARNDVCGGQTLYREATVTEALACFDRSCEEFEACIDALFE